LKEDEYDDVEDDDYDYDDDDDNSNVFNNLFIFMLTQQSKAN
jgi:hypothetical protein